MGEFADEFLGFIVDPNENVGDFEDGYPFSFVGFPARASKICKYCGAAQLHWEELNGNWRLFTWEGKLHNCALHKLQMRRSKLT